MKNNRTLKLILSVAILVSPLLAQSTKTDMPPDFNGTWILDKQLSVFYFSGRRTDNGYDYAGDYDNYKLIIKQDAGIIVVKQNFLFKTLQKEYETTISPGAKDKNVEQFIVDISPSVSSHELVVKDVSISSKSRWKGGKLIRIGDFSFQNSGWSAEYGCAFEQTYELSKDGNSLIITTNVQIMVSPNNPIDQKSRLQFRRA